MAYTDYTIEKLEEALITYKLDFEHKVCLKVAIEIIKAHQLVLNQDSDQNLMNCVELSDEEINAPFKPLSANDVRDKIDRMCK